MGHHNEAKLDVKFIDFARQMNLYLNHFPKHEKYGLCQQIRNSAYEVYGFIVESQKRYSKKTSLTNLDIAHEQLRMFLRLAFELGYFKFKIRYFHHRPCPPHSQPAPSLNHPERKPP